jgi:hypothetical protein
LGKRGKNRRQSGDQQNSDPRPESRKSFQDLGRAVGRDPLDDDDADDWVNRRDREYDGPDDDDDDEHDWRKERDREVAEGDDDQFDDDDTEETEDEENARFEAEQAEEAELAKAQAAERERRELAEQAEAVERQRLEAEERERQKAEEQEAEELAKLEAEERAFAEQERREAAEREREEAEEFARLEAEERREQEAAERERQATAERERLEAAERERAEAERQEAERQRVLAVDRAQREADERKRLAAAESERAEAAERTARENERRAAQDQERARAQEERERAKAADKEHREKAERVRREAADRLKAQAAEGKRAKVAEREQRDAERRAQRDADKQARAEEREFERANQPERKSLFSRWGKTTAAEPDDVEMSDEQNLVEGPGAAPATDSRGLGAGIQGAVKKLVQRLNQRPERNPDAQEGADEEDLRDPPMHAGEDVRPEKPPEKPRIRMPAVQTPVKAPPPSNGSSRPTQNNSADKPKQQLSPSETNMTELFLAYSERDRDRVGFVIQGLEKAGFVVSTGYDDSDAFKNMEKSALEVKRAGAFIPLLTASSSGSEELRRMMRAGLLYGKPLVAVRLEQAAETGVYANDEDLLRATRYEEDTEALTDELERAVDLYEPEESFASAFSADGDEEQDADAFVDGRPRGPVNVDVSRLVETLKNKGVVPTKISSAIANARDEIEVDSLGLPKSSESMLAHWNLIEKDGGTRELLRFADDYQDDPYFATIAEEGAERLKRKKFMRGALIGVDSLVGMVVAGIMFYIVAGYCLDNGCFNANFQPTNAAISSSQSGFSGNDARLRQEVQRARASVAALNRQVNDLSRQNSSLTQQLNTSRKESGQLTARLAETERALRQLQSGQGNAVPTTPRPSTSDNQDFARLQQQLDIATRQANAARRDVEQARASTRQAENQVLQLTQTISQKDARISELERRPRGGGETQTTTIVTQQPTRSPASFSSGRLGGAERLLVHYRDLLLAKAGGRSRAVLTSKDLLALQACILKRTGALGKVDGAWGIETTEAFFLINEEEAGWVIECLRRS